MNLIKIAIITISLYPSVIKCQDDGPIIFCGDNICHPNGGKCFDQIQCICNEGYTTINFPTYHVNCNYKQVSRTKAFLIELFFGFGLGHFYTGRTGMGLFKLFCYSLFCSCCCGSLYMIKKIREEMEAEDHPYVSLLFVLSIVYKVILVLWQLIDSVLFLINYYPDGKGVQLY